MTYFHVLVATVKSPDDFRSVAADLDEQRLKAEFIKPWKRRKDLIVDGQVIRHADISRVKITRTDDNADAVLAQLLRDSVEAIDRINRESSGIYFVSAGDGHSNDDLHLVGKDVTAEFLRGDAFSDGQSSIARWLSNPWVVTVGGGLLLLWASWALLS